MSNAVQFNFDTDPDNPLNKLYALEQRLAALELQLLSVNRLEEVTPDGSGVFLNPESGTRTDGILLAKRLNHVSVLGALSNTASLPAGILAEDNSLIVELTGAIWNESGSAQNLTMEIRLGASGSEVAVTSATAVSISNSATQRGFQYTARISQAPCMGTWVSCYEELHVDGVNLFQRSTIKKITGIESLDEAVSLILGETLGGTATTWTVYNNHLIVRVEQGLTDTDTVLWWSQPTGSDSYDTFIQDATPNNNYSTNAVINIGESNAAAAVNRGLIKFLDMDNLAAVIDQYEIVSANLLLKISADFSGNARTLNAKVLARNWVLGQTTWNEYSTGNSWTTAGGLGAGDVETGVYGSLAVTASETVGKTIAIPMTITKTGIQTGFYNYGFILYTDVESNDMYQYHSGNAASPNAAPILQIELRRL